MSLSLFSAAGYKSPSKSHSPLPLTSSRFTSGGSSASTAKANAATDAFGTRQRLASWTFIIGISCGSRRFRSPNARSSCKADHKDLRIGTSDEDDVGPEEHDSFEVGPESVSARLDVLLSTRYQQSRSYFEALIDKGAVLVNGSQRKKSFHKFKEGDLIDIRFLSDDRTLPLKPEAIPLDVLHEDEDILIVNKPSGLVVHPAPGHWSGTLVNAVLHHLGATASGSGSARSMLPSAAPGPESQHRPGIAHRLDVGTSGVIAVAKTENAYKTLSESFASREVQKTYLAVTASGHKYYNGFIAGDGYTVTHPIGRSPLNRREMAVVPEDKGGRPCESIIRSLAVERESSFLEIRPKTGRTHQIRVHLAQEQTPVLGDETYGWGHANRRFAGLAPRPMLHAFRLVFAHPRTGKRVEFEAPLPDDMKACLRRMEPLGGEVEYVSHLLNGPSSSSTVSTTNLKEASLADHVIQPEAVLAA